MNKMMSVLFASGNESKLNELTLHRTTASLPFGGRYRLIDFSLSNMVNSDITTIGLVTRSNYSSLMDHIRMGRDWDLNRKNSGIAVFPPFVLNTSREMYKGKIEAFIRECDSRSRSEYLTTRKLRLMVARAKGERFIPVRAHTRRIPSHELPGQELLGGQV